MDERLLVGASEVDITPPVGLPMDGYLARTDVNRGIHDPLLAQVLILDNTRTRVALIALDVLAVSATFADELRHSLAATLETTPDSIMICASHTHGGPSGLQDWFPIGTASSLNSQLMDLVRARLVNAARSALGRLIPTRLAYGLGEIDGIGMDRNQPAPAPDPFVTVLRFDKSDGTALAVVFHYACHPTVLGPQLDYSADFPGAARRRIQARHPQATCLYLNGAAGNISTRFSRRNQTFDEVARLGGLLGDRAIMLLEQAEYCSTDLGSACRAVDLPLRAFSAASIRMLPATGNQRIDQTRAEGALIEAQLERVFLGRTSLPATLRALQIGPWKLLGVPGEPFNELAAHLRHVSPFALVVGYANDYLGYFPTQQAISTETYEALSSPYDARALDLIQSTLVALL
jgi:neutral ceramidase